MKAILPMLALLLTPLALGAQESLSDAARVQLSVINHLVRQNHSHAPERPNTAVCIKVGSGDSAADPSPALLSGVESMLPVLPRSRCEVDLERTYRGKRRPRLVTIESREPAIEISVGDVAEPVADSVRVEGGYYEDVLSGAGYRCVVRREASSWRVDDCVLIAISD